ncbi:MAG: SLC13 family permease [Candidatus Saccharibacteria bacterium]|nr:SLC13 family permease [Candidatus Saccharibacteria bacterium]
MQELITLLVLAGIFISLLRGLVAPSVAFLIGLAALVITDIVSINEAFVGFSNQSLITIASLFVIARAIENTVQVDKITAKLFGASKSIRRGLIRIMAPVSISSAFVNNTPVVAMLINPIITWSKKNHLPSSKFLIPLSYAAIFGGALTLIGTSTNLVVSGLLTDYGFEGFSFFELTAYSLPLAIIGIGFIVLFAPRLIPERTLADIDAADIEKRFTIDMLPKKTVIGKSINQAGLRNLKDVFLVELIRQNGDVLAPVNPATTIQPGDVLRFSGNADSLIELAHHTSLKAVEDKHASRLAHKTSYIEVVVGHNKSLVGSTLAEIGFRSKYQAAVLAIFRAGEKISGSLGNVALRPGDSLLIVSDEAFIPRWQDRSDFLYMRYVSKTKTSNDKGSFLITVTVGLIIGLIALGVPLSIAVLSGALSTILLRLNSTTQARNAIDFDLLVMIAAAIGVAKGVDASGLATALSQTIIDYMGVFGTIGLLLGVIIATSILTELITNAAAALLVFPIAIATAVQSSADPRMFAIAIAIAASLSFISPLGYQTNTMVYSAGAYKFSDFMRLGIWLNIITTISLTVLLSFGFGLSF